MSQTPQPPTSSPTTAPTTPTTLVLHEDKQCKGSVRYATNDPESPISSIYVNRSFAAPMPKSIVVTLTAK